MKRDETKRRDEVDKKDICFDLHDNIGVVELLVCLLLVIRLQRCLVADKQTKMDEKKR